jgi:hypothetical protein
MPRKAADLRKGITDRAADLFRAVKNYEILVTDEDEREPMHATLGVFVHELNNLRTQFQLRPPMLPQAATPEDEHAAPEGAIAQPTAEAAA